MLNQKTLVAVGAGGAALGGVLLRAPPVAIIALCVLIAHALSGGHFMASIIVSIVAFALSSAIVTTALPRVYARATEWGMLTSAGVTGALAVLATVLGTLASRAAFGGGLTSSAMVGRIAVVAFTVVATAMHFGPRSAVAVGAAMVTALVLLRQREKLHFGIGIAVLAFLVSHGIMWRSAIMSASTDVRRMYSTAALTLVLSAVGVYAITRVRPFYIALIAAVLWLAASNLQTSASGSLALPDGRVRNVLRGNRVAASPVLA